MIKTRDHAMSPKPGPRTRFERFMNLRFRGQYFFNRISSILVLTLIFEQVFGQNNSVTFTPKL